MFRGTKALASSGTALMVRLPWPFRWEVHSPSSVAGKLRSFSQSLPLSLGCVDSSSLIPKIWSIAAPGCSHSIMILRNVVVFMLALVY